MATFKYRAESRDGSSVAGVIDAYDEFEAISQLRETVGMVTSIREVESRAGGNILTKELGSPLIKDKSLALLCSQFAITLEAGLPVVRAVELIAQQSTDKKVKKLLGEVGKDVAAGYGLAQSMENKGAKQLPPTFIETVRAGEATGTLEQSFHKLQAYYESAAQVKGKVRSALMYPIFLLALAAIVVAIIMVVVMPTFVDLFESLNAELPLITVWLMAVSSFLGKWWPVVAVVILAAAFLFRWWSKTDSGALKTSKWLLRIPVVGKVSEMKGASQFANTMSTLLTAGLPMIQAVSSTASTMDNRWLGRRLGGMTPRLEEGRRLGECMAELGEFPPLLVEMTAMGEETGALEETLDHIGTYYDSEVQTSTQRAMSMIQPALIILMGLIIGVVVVALYLPMFSMYSSM